MWQRHWVNERGKPVSQKPLTAQVSAKQSIKRQLHTTQVGTAQQLYHDMHREGG